MRHFWMQLLMHRIGSTRVSRAVADRPKEFQFVYSTLTLCTHVSHTSRYI